MGLLSRGSRNILILDVQCFTEKSNTNKFPLIKTLSVLCLRLELSPTPKPCGL